MSSSALDLPVLRVVDRNAKPDPARLMAPVWNEAVAVFAKGGLNLRAIDRVGAVLQHPSGRPRFDGLDRKMINLVLSDRVPLDWDKGRSLAGISAVYEGYCVCVIAASEAHGNRIPFVSVNTIVHELLHVLLGDVFSARTGVIQGQTAEARADLYATRMWLFGDGAAVRQSARACLQRLGYFASSNA